VADFNQNLRSFKFQQKCPVPAFTEMRSAVPSSLQTYRRNTQARNPSDCLFSFAWDAQVNFCFSVFKLIVAYTISFSLANRLQFVALLLDSYELVGIKYKVNKVYVSFIYVLVFENAVHNYSELSSAVYVSCCVVLRWILHLFGETFNVIN
jgi:hypothetical protein